MIYRTTDTDDIYHILNAGGIAENIGWNRGMETPISEDIHYLIVVDSAKKAGLWILHPGEHGLQIHANMLPGYRGDFAKKAANEVLEYGFTLSDTIYAAIPERFGNVVRFSEEMGLRKFAESNGDILLKLEASRWDGEQ